MDLLRLHLRRLFRHRTSKDYTDRGRRSVACKASTIQSDFHRYDRELPHKWCHSCGTTDSDNQHRCWWIHDSVDNSTASLDEECTRTLIWWFQLVPRDWMPSIVSDCLRGRSCAYPKSGPVPFAYWSKDSARCLYGSESRCPLPHEKKSNQLWDNSSLPPCYEACSAIVIVSQYRTNQCKSSVRTSISVHSDCVSSLYGGTTSSLL